MRKTAHTIKDIYAARKHIREFSRELSERCGKDPGFIEKDILRAKKNQPHLPERIRVDRLLRPVPGTKGHGVHPLDPGGIQKNLYGPAIYMYTDE